MNRGGRRKNVQESKTDRQGRSTRSPGQTSGRGIFTKSKFHV